MNVAKPAYIPAIAALLLASCSQGDEQERAVSNEANVTANAASPAPAATPASGSNEAEAPAENQSSAAEAAPDKPLTAAAEGNSDAVAEAPPAASSTLAAAAPAKPPAAFAICTTCHTASKGGAHGIGPNLYGVYGAKAGEGSFTRFSPAMKASGIIWDDAKLDAWIEKPSAVIPGTTMAFAGIKDAEKRRQIIAYLRAQK
ncbi:cytochrome c family protein [Sphingobium sp. DC-2]|uniref:c-type cytochrome n=1 Tax=Sphingobium sp. DC-2 TaxID=1303256 RepID=UPI0009DD45FB|nr:c-type cytochrome [Sphingobium sp. DC-2]